MSASARFNPHTLIQRDETRFLSSMINGEVILMNLQTGTHMALHPSAMAVWCILVMPVTITALIAEIVTEYDISEEEATTDTMDFLCQLHDHGVIKVLAN